LCVCVSTCDLLYRSGTPRRAHTETDHAHLLTASYACMCACCLIWRVIVGSVCVCMCLLSVGLLCVCVDLRSSLSAAARTLHTLAIQIRAELRVRLVKRGQRTEPHISSFLFSVLCYRSGTSRRACGRRRPPPRPTSWRSSRQVAWPSSGATAAGGRCWYRLAFTHQLETGPAVPRPPIPEGGTGVPLPQEAAVMPEGGLVAPTPEGGLVAPVPEGGAEAPIPEGGPEAPTWSGSSRRSSLATRCK